MSQAVLQTSVYHEVFLVKNLFRTFRIHKLAHSSLELYYGIGPSRKQDHRAIDIRFVYKISGPKRPVKITDRFTCTSANVIYCITCTLCKKLYIDETGRRLGHRFREHLRDVEKDDKDASKPVARHFNLPNHSKEHMSICGLSLHQGTTDSRKNLEQRFLFQIGTLNPHGINERFYSINLFLFFT